jgi:hypothetical protein
MRSRNNDSDFERRQTLRYASQSRAIRGCWSSVSQDDDARLLRFLAARCAFLPVH